jgi:glycerol-3-phosphate dehydrogenase
LVASLDASPSATSREHELFFEDGALTIVGGKLTTMRKMAKQIVDRLCHWGRRRGLSAVPGKCITATSPLPGASARPMTAAAQGAFASLPQATQAHLRARYGSRAPFVAELCVSDASLHERIDEELPDIWAEVVFSARCEQARTVEDVLRRRLSVFRHGRQQGLNASERAARLLAKELGASQEQQAAWLAQYKAAVALTQRWASDAANGPSPGSAP